MKLTKNLLTPLLLLVLFFSLATAGDQAPWVDMEKCPICSNINKHEGLMQNMSWEHHLTKTGMLTVSTVNPDYDDKFLAAAAGMKIVIDKIMSGEDIKVCGYCTSITGMMKDGMSVENVKTTGSHVLVLSSKDDAMIDRIHTHGNKTIDFMNAMQKQMSKPDPHAGHNH